MANYDMQAEELNARIAGACPQAMNMLSDRGKAIYFPERGILSQSAAARGKAINATIGIALEDDGSPMRLDAVAARVNLPPQEVFPYASSAGNSEARAAWKKMLFSKNPALAGKSFSLPVVVCALTHGLSVAGYMFCDAGDSIIIPDLYWENYELVFELAYGAKLDKFPMFDVAGAPAGRGHIGGFNTAELRHKLLSGLGGKKIVCLNFPNNPAGYTPTNEEVSRIKSILLEAARGGSKIVALIDDAYFGLVFEKGVYEQSIFSELCDLHSNILAVKLDGPTKEDYAWGLRVGFITYGISGGTADLYEALEAKTAGVVRGSVSNASNLSQSLLVEAWSNVDYERQKNEKRNVLSRRHEKVKSVLASHPEYEKYFVALPFNSGYFMCVRMIGIDSEKLCARLLNKYSTGVVALNGVIRIAFSAVPVDRIELLFNNLYQAARDVASGRLD